jgi:RES domain-containing protein
MPLPAPFGGTELVAWRLDQARQASTWDSGEGAYRVGGRWNARGTRAVYCSVDPATAILEVAVHKQLPTLDTVPHVLTALTVTGVADVQVVRPDDVPSPDWLRPGRPVAEQQAFGTRLLERNAFVLIPSVVSRHSWNLIFVASVARDRYALRFQEPFVLDSRLHSAATGTLRTTRRAPE